MTTPRDARPQTLDGIELRHLRALAAVADELSFSRAAHRLHITQPALSRQVRALEKLVGCELLQRNTHGVELTLAGEALLASARQLLAGLAEAVTAARALGGELNARMSRIWAPVQALHDSPALTRSGPSTRRCARNCRSRPRWTSARSTPAASPDSR